MTLWSPRVLLLVACTSAVGCAGAATSRAPDEPVMPFHVLVYAPGSALEVGKALPPAALGSAPGDADTTEMTYRADPEHFTRRLSERLDGIVFAVATPAAGAPGGEDRVTAAEAITLARQQGADLLLYCELTSSAPVTMERTSPISLNVLLWILGGPSIWVLDELTYDADARVEATLYDVAGSGQVSAVSAGQLARVADAPATFQGVETDFIDREGWQGLGSLGSYFATIFTSTFAVAKDNPHVEGVVTDAIERTLVEGVVDSIERRRMDLIRGRHMEDRAAISVRDVLARRTDGGRVVVTASVIIGLQGRETVMAGYRLEAGDATVEARVDEGALGVDAFGRPVRFYSIDDVLEDVPADVTSLRMILVAGARDRVSRSFTFRIDD